MHQSYLYLFLSSQDAATYGACSRCKLFKCSKKCLLQTPIDCEKQSLLLGLEKCSLGPGVLSTQHDVTQASTYDLTSDISQANHCTNKHSHMCTDHDYVIGGRAQKELYQTFS